VTNGGCAPDGVAATERQDMGGLAKQRLEALVDGIFAVAMTLLVLDIKLPENVVYATDGALWARLVTLERHFLIYVISFLVIGMYWIGHHMQYHFVRLVDRRMIWINLVYLLLVSFVPFTTDLVGDHKDLALPIAIYGGTLLALSGTAFVHTRYLARHPALATSTFTRETAGLFERRAALFALVPLASIGIAFVSPHAALFAYLLLVVAHVVPTPLDSRITNSGEESEAVRAREPVSK
jgi:uncharacterized membrane protein